MNNNLIYGLVDPRNDMVCYVGKTTVGMSRPMTHLNYSHSKYIRNWVSELNKLGLKPEIVVLEDNLPLNFLSEREKYWINEYYQINTNILNIEFKKDAEKIYDFYITKEQIDFLIEILSNIPKLVKSARLFGSKTQQQMSDLVQINRSTICQMESIGDGRISTLVKILKLCQTKDRFYRKKKIRLYNEKSYNESQKNIIRKQK